MSILERPSRKDRGRETVSGIAFADATWATLAEGSVNPPETFDPTTLDSLPPPARRLLAAAVPAGAFLASVIRLEMIGEIKIGGRWLGFNASQILRAGVGFVWAPVVGGRLVRFTGADVFGPDGARIEFRLHSRVPVVRGSGQDIARSAAGRLAAETAAWLPQALTPQAGARWVGVDDQRAIVTLDAAGTNVDVEVDVGADGNIVWLGLQRWKDSAKPPGYASFGGVVDSTFTTPSGVQIAGTGTVGWDWQTPRQSEGEFFRYRIVSARFGDTPDGERGTL